PARGRRRRAPQNVQRDGRGPDAARPCGGLLLHAVDRHRAGAERAAYLRTPTQGRRGAASGGDAHPEAGLSAVDPELDRLRAFDAVGQSPLAIDDITVPTLAPVPPSNTPTTLGS